MQLNQKRIIIAIGILALCSIASSADNLAEKDLGTEKGEPIQAGFFFDNGRYIEAPYVVERRGVDTYINNELIRSGPDYPPFDPRVPEDPGDPPPDESPYWPVFTEDYQDSYWARKWRYLATHYDMKGEGRERMIEALRKSTLVKEANWDPEWPGSLRIVMKSGKEFNFGIQPLRGFLDPPLTKEEFVQQARKSQAFYEVLLRNDIALFAKPGREVYVQGQRAVETLEILTSDTPEEEKVRALTELEVVEPGLEDIVYTFRPTAQLTQRIEKRKAEMVRQKQMADVKAEVNTILEQVEAQEILTDPADVTLEPSIPVTSTSIQPDQKGTELPNNAGLNTERKKVDSSLQPWLAALIVVVIVQFAALIALGVLFFHMRKKQK